MVIFLKQLLCYKSWHYTFCILIWIFSFQGLTAIGIRCTLCLWNYVELFWNSLDNDPSSIVFYLEMKVEVEVGVHNIRSRFTPRFECFGLSSSNLVNWLSNSQGQSLQYFILIFIPYNLSYIF